MQHMTIGLALALAGAITAVNPSPAQAQEQYEASSRGTRLLEGGNGFAIKMLVERSNLGGGEVEIGEITFPVGPGQSRRGHVHGTVEIFYVLLGELDHIVNGESHILTPGMVGIVRTGDSVVHRVVGDEPVKALVIWAPGGEIDGIARNLRETPIQRN